MQILDGRKELYQWDIRPKITSNRFKVGEEIHFTNIKQTKALPVLTKEYNGKVVVEVPSILLQNAFPITVYWYVTIDDSSFTKEEYQLPVKQKPKPEDYVYTETEILTVEDYVNKAVNEAKESGEFKGDKGDPGADGKDGKDGKDGVNGKDGYTPQRNVDYWTEADKSEIKSYVDEAILGGEW